MRALSRVGRVFVAPADGSPVREAEAEEASRSRTGAVRGEVAAVLAPADEVRNLAAAVALAAAGRGVSVVAAWRCTGRPAISAPAGVAARRLAASLVARGLSATASGRLVTVELAEGEREAVAALGPVEAAAGDVPLVLALGGPRGRWFDEALTRCAAVHVHAADPALAALTVARLSEQGIAARALGAGPTGVARRLAGSGLVLPGTAARLRPRPPAEAGA